MGQALSPRTWTEPSRRRSSSQRSLGTPDFPGMGPNSRCTGIGVGGQLLSMLSRIGLFLQAFMSQASELLAFRRALAISSLSSRDVLGRIRSIAFLT